MNASQSMTVARRLSLGFGLIILVLIAMVTVTLVGLSTINQQIYEITQVNAVQGRLATKMVDAAQEMRVQYRQMLLDTDPAKDRESAARLAKARESFLKSEGEIKALFQKYAATMSEFDKVIGIGRIQWPLIGAAVGMGGNVRVGLEDNVYLRPGVLAKSSGEQVTQLREIAERLGLEIATADEAREILSLKGNDNVNF